MIDYQANTEVRVLPDGETIAKRCAQRFVEIAIAAVKEKGSFHVALAGGSTPKILYSLLVDDPALRSQVPWDKMRVFFGDERHVGPDDPQSNFCMARETMFSKSPLQPAQVTRIKGELPEAEDAAKEYEQALRTYFKLSEGQFPRFDLVLLGMGSEGHTLSIFPGTKALRENRRIAVHNWVGKVLMDRITLTAPAVNNARDGHEPVCRIRVSRKPATDNPKNTTTTHFAMRLADRAVKYHSSSEIVKPNTTASGSACR